MTQYDAVVIGSGTGGISAALTLANAHKKTLLIEQHNTPGGCSTSFVRGRFEFDASLHEFCDIGEKGDYGDSGKLLMEEYMIPVEWIQIPDLFRVVGTTRSGKHMDVTLPSGRDECINAMEKAVPGSKEAMTTYFDLLKVCFEAADYYYEHKEELDGEGTISIKKLIFAAKYPEFLKVAEKPFNEVLRKIRMPEDAIDILGTYWSYIGLDCEHISFVHESFMFYMYNLHRPSFCRYTAHGLATAACERFKELGGDIWLNVKAEKTVTDPDGKIIGVETSNGFVGTNYIIADMNPQTAYAKLINEEIKMPKREYKRALMQQPASSFFNIYLGLNRSPDELGIDSYTIFFPHDIDSHKNYELSQRLEGNYYGIAVIYNILDPEVSEKGTTVMTMTVQYNAETWKGISQRDYHHKKSEVAQKVIEAFEIETGIKIKEYIEEIEIATPRTFARYLGTPMGSVYGCRYNDHDTMLSRLMTMKKDQPLHGFKTCGASGARGDGYSMTYINGNDIGKLILEEMENDRKSGDHSG